MNIFLSLIERRDLVWQFFSRNVKSRHRGSFLGPIWLLVNPLLMLCLYVFAFGVVFGGRLTDSTEESTLDYALGVLIGLNIIGFISGVISSTPSSILSHPNFVRKVVFPLEVLPVAQTGSLLYDMLIGFGLSLLGVVFLGPGLLVTCLWIPILLFPILMIGLGLALLLSSLSIYIRDFGQISSFLCLSILYSSGVFYSAEKASMVAPSIWNFLQWNPLLQIIDSLREIILWGREPSWWWVSYSWAVAVGVLTMGTFVFQKLRPSFGDLI